MNGKSTGKKRKGQTCSSRMQGRRLLIQSLAALLQNANVKGFFTGQIWQGKSKSICVPGLNCYSCPGAVGACPIGSLQNTLSGYSFKIPYYICGLLIFFGVFLGRIVCGFLCPFGLVQDLLHKIPFPKKVRTFRGDRILRKLKYLVLLLLVVVLPICVKLTPFFCKYLCPSGTLSGCLLAFSDSTIGSMLGSQFAFKCSILVLIILLSLCLFRPFCKYLCPLGAIYAPFNKVAVFGLKLDQERCVDCGRCVPVCPMIVDPSKTPDHTECIRCGKCVDACQVQALSMGYRRIWEGKKSTKNETPF